MKNRSLIVGDVAVETQRAAGLEAGQCSSRTSRTLEINASNSVFILVFLGGYLYGPLSGALWRCTAPNLQKIADKRSVKKDCIAHLGIRPLIRIPKVNVFIVDLSH